MMPSAEPPPLTLTVTFSHWRSNSSAILRAIGSIVVEPLMNRFDVSAIEL
jgi:hypothetical protein